MDAMAIETDRGIAKEQGGFGLEHPFPFSLRRNRGRSFGRRLRSCFTEHDHVALLDHGETAAARDAAFFNDGDHGAARPVIDLQVGDLGDLLDLVADSQRFVKGHAGPTDAPAR